jgi:hypothetical protein
MTTLDSRDHATQVLLKANVNGDCPLLLQVQGSHLSPWKQLASVTLTPASNLKHTSL